MRSEWKRRTKERTAAAAASGYCFVNVVSPVPAALGQQLQFTSALKEGRRENEVSRSCSSLGEHCAAFKPCSS